MGGHFYATSTLRDSCYGLYHDFITGRISTNTQHVQNMFRILTCLMAFYQNVFMGDEDNILPEDMMDMDIGRSLLL